MTRQHLFIVILFAAAALLRFADVFRPINNPSWREADLGSISRNFVTESMDLRYPAVDWRGAGPGYTEMELPLYPWLTAVTYQVFGIHDQIARVWAFLFSLGSMLFFYRLAREYLSVFAATIAFAFFAINPLMVGIATSIQPEGFMLLSYLASIYFFVKWLRTDSDRYFLAAAAATAFALLAKAPSAHIGLMFGVLLIEKRGLSVLKDGRIWFLGVISVLPSAIWYFHAKNLWLTYGNSLGISNEYHWIGWDFFTDPSFITGIARIEFLYVWTAFGSIAALFAMWRGYRTEATRFSLFWLASILLFYILAARTTSEEWAVYYHAFSIPPVALLFGSSIERVWEFARDFADRYSQRRLIGNLSRIALILVVAGAVLGSLALQAKQVRANLIENRKDPHPAWTFAHGVKPLMTADGPIIVSGGVCRDEKGYQVAYNASYMFYWLERRGWNICVEEESLAKVAELRALGAKYFVAEKKFMPADPSLMHDLEDRYPVLANADGFEVFDLSGRN